MDPRYFKTRYSNNPPSLQLLLLMYRVNPQLLTREQLRDVIAYENAIHGGSSFNYFDRFTSFLERGDNSFLAPWGSSDDQHVPGFPRERMKIQPGSFFSYDHMLALMPFPHMDLIDELLNDEEEEGKFEEETRKIRVDEEEDKDREKDHQESQEK